MSSNTKSTDKLEELDWVNFRSMSDTQTETFWQRAKRKTSENPFVPIGLVATVCALSFGLYSFQKGNIMMSQYMMRARVTAQAFTVGAMIIGCYVFSRQKNPALKTEVPK